MQEGSSKAADRSAAARRWPLAAVGALALLAAAYGVLRAFGRTRPAGTSADLLSLLALWCVAAALAFVVAWSAGGTRRRIAGRAALLLAPPLLLVAAGEAPVVASDFDWRRHLPRPGDDLFLRVKRNQNPWNRDDAELIYTRPPGGHVQGRTVGDCVGWLGAPPDAEYAYDLRYDARGYRNATTLARADVALVGDSFVEGALVADDELLTRRMAAALGRDVANLGVGGYGPQQEAIVVRRHALPLAPRLVYWCFFEGNDLADAARYEQDRREMGAVQEVKAGHLIRSFQANLLGMAGCLVTPRSPGDMERARQQSGVLRVEGPDRGRRLYFPYVAAPLSERDEAALAETAALLEVAAHECAAAGARLVVVFVPEKFRIYGELCDLAPGSAAAAWRCSDLPLRLGELAAARGCDWLDLTPTLREAAARGPLLYFTDDGHWNGAGHAVVAGRMAADAAARLAGEPPR